MADSVSPDPKIKHERRVVGHASGWQEQTSTCVCGKPWPCAETSVSSNLITLIQQLFCAANQLDSIDCHFMGEACRNAARELDRFRRTAKLPSPGETSEARDAARYRFLRQPTNAIVYAKDRHAWGQNASGHVRWDTPEQLDAAVDAAMSSSEKAKPERCGHGNEWGNCPYPHTDSQ